MQEEVDVRPEDEEQYTENEDGEFSEMDGENGFREFEDAAEFEDMEPDEALEPVGEQSPNTREAFEEPEERDEDDFFFEEDE